MTAKLDTPASAGHESAGMVPSAFARLLSDYLQSRILDVPALAELAAQVPRGPTARTRWLNLLTEIAERLNEPDLPLKIGAAMQVRHLGIAGQVLLSCDTLGEAAEQFCRYCRLVDDMGYTRIHRSSTIGEATFHWGNNGVPPPAMEQIWASAMLSLSQWLTGRKDIACEFHFRHPRPDDLAPFERMLGPQLHFGQKATRNVVPAWMMALPVSTHVPEMRAIVEAQAEASLRALAHDGVQMRDQTHAQTPELVRRVSSLIADQLAKGTATVELIAPQLALSTRTLNRRLAEADTSFRLLCEAVRRSRAETLLAEPAVSLAEISFMLGYHEQSTFQRAFKRWTGMTPGEFRASH
ncbi:MAG: AraC family transcriptional regulator ligand-binding domain-containing protein [Nevskiales bacterium]